MPKPLRAIRPTCARRPFDASVDQTDARKRNVLIDEFGLRIDDRRTHPREATQIPGRSSPAGRSPAPRRPPSGHTDPPGAIRPSSPDGGSGAPATPPFSAPVPNPRGNVRRRDLAVQRVRVLPGDPVHVLRPRTSKFVDPAHVRPRVGEDGSDHPSDVSRGDRRGLAPPERQFDAASVADRRTGEGDEEAFQKDRSAGW